jgi:hypothetical protein
MVCGNRLNGQIDPKALHKIFHIGNRLIAFTYNFLNGIPLEDPLTGLRVIRADILRNWQIKSKGFDIEVELNHHVERRGYGIVEVPIQYRERLGEKKLGLKNGVEIFIRIMLETTYLLFFLHEYSYQFPLLSCDNLLVPNAKDVIKIGYENALFLSSF